MNIPMLQITSVITREMTSKNGRLMKFQSALFLRGDGAVFPVDFLLQDDRPVAVGTYTLATSSYEPGRFGIEFRPRPGELVKPVARPASQVA